MNRRAFVWVGMLLGLCACATPVAPPSLPGLRVAPAAFGQELHLAQRLTVLEAPAAEGASADGPEQRERPLEVVLQVDAQTVRLAALAMHQRVLSLVWDGVHMQVQRHPLLPAAVDPERVLRDIALVYAPLGALQALLPPGWTLEQTHAGERVLRHAGEARVCVRRVDAQRAEIDNRAERYRLRIESQPLE
ncbi:DUF3261 domain-containing protein [Inhella gelatinilytica]|uniref:DUF3261 domain-containing protein n=1 Tax=Inhella gelatinilytica TaxID=2795030 RepID=A0A931NCI5_9BURK|nr:DUF3261 domain-containing protein [Inhella gelatinilytica]MBH9551599.1 DUF3261 domain-containing protein [Inhella gelatinilytica]